MLLLVFISILIKIALRLRKRYLRSNSPSFLVLQPPRRSFSPVSPLARLWKTVGPWLLLWWIMSTQPGCTGILDKQPASVSQKRTFPPNFCPGWTRGRRVPNTANSTIDNGSLLPISFANGRFKICTWNAQALLHTDTEKRSLKGNIVRQLSLTSDIICLQEVHGYSGEIVSELSAWLPNWKVFFSAVTADGMAKRDSGGVLFAISPHIVGTFSLTIFQPGRVASLSIFSSLGSLDIMNIHNYGISSQNFQSLSQHLDFIQQQASMLPLDFFAAAVGDCNYIIDGEPRFRVGQVPDTSSVASSVSAGASRAAQFGEVLSTWIELHQPYPTHFSSSNNSCARLDRVYVSTGVSAFMNLRISVCPVSPPETMFQQELSDHSPVNADFSTLPITTKASFPIPKWIFRDPDYAPSLRNVCDYASVLELPLVERLSCYKTCIRIVAKHVRNCNTICGSPISDLTVLNSISRAVWRQDVKLARELCSVSDLAREHVCISISNSISSSTSLSLRLIRSHSRTPFSLSECLLKPNSMLIARRLRDFLMH